MSSVFELDSVSLCFKNVRKRSLLYHMGKAVKGVDSLNQFTALDDISLNIEGGQTVGLIGRNGAGKTTLLRVLAGIYAPDGGTVTTNAQSISLLALGIGFDASASGYENIYLSSLLQGHSKKEVDAKVDQIIEFSGIEDFIENPVKTYSSGMRLRLAFSIAVQYEPEVLLIDEALSVGDAEFQRKSSRKMRELIEDKKRTVVIASHNLPQLSTMSDKIIWLDKGKLRMMGSPKEVVDAYSTEVSNAKN
jgi:ABC-type polysaccharide/polyol phosphate transport system ATPase subunit